MFKVGDIINYPDGGQARVTKVEGDILSVTRIGTVKRNEMTLAQFLNRKAMDNRNSLRGEAKEMGISYGMLSSLRNGVHADLRLSTARKIARYYRVSLEEIANMALGETG